MVGKLKKLTGTVILTATLLIVAKTYIILILTLGLHLAVHCHLHVIEIIIIRSVSRNQR